ncbi:ribbon-helix-helix protein, CopG family [Paenibacillus pinihumi]|uniref:ribbon-helix-helix protein, CopG family n=1 Tax=Paenibacillus pinihumi TaxID=669462 RepID=UPI001FDEEB00|nr:ribbon-helix-helix protein, CopG family [Paenibacillus pinihumi]
MTLLNQHRIKVDVSNKEGQLGFVFNKGGLREGAGRKAIGVTKKVSLTLAEELWEKLEASCEQQGQSRSELLRSLIEAHYSRG